MLNVKCNPMFRVYARLIALAEKNESAGDSVAKLTPPADSTTPKKAESGDFTLDSVATQKGSR